MSKNAMGNDRQMTGCDAVVGCTRAIILTDAHAYKWKNHFFKMNGDVGMA